MGITSLSRTLGSLGVPGRRMYQLCSFTLERTRRQFLEFEIFCAFRLLDNRKGFRGVIFELFTFVGAYCRVPNNRVVGVGIHLSKTK